MPKDPNFETCFKCKKLIKTFGSNADYWVEKCKRGLFLGDLIKPKWFHASCYKETSEDKNPYPFLNRKSMTNKEAKENGLN